MNNIKKINKILFSVFVAAFMFYIIKYPESSTDIVLRGLDLCYRVIIPVIFPFLVFSKMLVNSSVFKILGRILNKPARLLFGVSGDYANAFIIGGILGFPIGAKTVREVYLLNKNKNEAERTLAFCNNCSVSFVISIAGIAVFGSFKTGLYLFCIQLISAVFTGIIIRFLFRAKNAKSPLLKGGAGNADGGLPPQQINLTETISESVNGILNICGTVLFFYIVANVSLEYLKSTPFMADLLNPDKSGIFSGFVKTLVSGIFEISSGIYSLVDFNITEYPKLILSSVILSWSGISVHFQIKYILKNIDLSLKPYFTGRIIHVIISIPATALTYGTGFAITGITWLAAAILVAVIAIILYLFEKNSKKRKKYSIIYK